MVLPIMEIPVPEMITPALAAHVGHQEGGFELATKKQQSNN
jgi:hypothetical protein